MFVVESKSVAVTPRRQSNLYFKLDLSSIDADSLQTIGSVKACRIEHNTIYCMRGTNNNTPDWEPLYFK